MHDSAALQADIARLALGERAALRRVYESTSAHLFGIALRVLKRRELAEDVLQEAFVNVWHSAGSYQASQAQPMTWLISIVRNKALDHLRAGKRHVADSIDNDDDPEAHQIADERPNPMQLLLKAEEAMGIRGCMDSLDASPRQCLSLAYYHGMSQSEIAEHITAPIGSVKAWVRRGLERLKKCVEQRP